MRSPLTHPQRTARRANRFDPIVCVVRSVVNRYRCVEVDIRFMGRPNLPPRRLRRLQRGGGYPPPPLVAVKEASGIIAITMDSPKICPSLTIRVFESARFQFIAMISVAFWLETFLHVPLALLLALLPNQERNSPTQALFLRHDPLTVNSEGFKMRLYCYSSSQLSSLAATKNLTTARDNLTTANDNLTTARDNLTSNGTNLTGQLGWNKT